MRSCTEGRGEREREIERETWRQQQMSGTELEAMDVQGMGGVGRGHVVTR